MNAEKKTAATLYTREFMDAVRTEHGLSRRERDDLERAVSMELSRPERQKWFRGSNNRIFRVVRALERERGTSFPESLPDKLSLYVRDAGCCILCMGPQPPQIARPQRAAAYLVTPAMRVAMGLAAVATCELPLGHEGLHSWDRRPRDPAMYANWAGLFPAKALVGSLMIGRRRQKVGSTSGMADAALPVARGRRSFGAARGRSQDAAPDVRIPNASVEKFSAVVAKSSITVARRLPTFFLHALEGATAMSFALRGHFLQQSPPKKRRRAAFAFAHRKALGFESPGRVCRR